MENVQLGIHKLPYAYLTSMAYLETQVYPDMYKNYYWSDDFSPDYYIALAKAGFIAVTDTYDEEELLLPEIQFSYAVLDFEALHISKKVSKLLQKKPLTLEINQSLDEVASQLNRYHKNCWLTPRYLHMLKATIGMDQNFEMLSVGIRENGQLIAGEIGYVIGRVYTSLSGFSSNKPAYRNYGTAQLVLLGQYLQQSGFDFWNLGQPHMSYKQALGTKTLNRQDFLTRWFKATHT